MQKESQRVHNILAIHVQGAKPFFLNYLDAFNYHTVLLRTFKALQERQATCISVEIWLLHSKNILSADNSWLDKRGL